MRSAEDRFLDALLPQLGVMPDDVVIPPGDDCAALRWGPDRLLLLTVDQLIGDRHFRRTGPGAATPEQAGRKLLARNLSDIAAMGGKPLFALLAVALGPPEDTTWLERFHGGLLELARAWHVALIGGDLARAPQDMVSSLTLLGEAPANRVLHRAGAQPGDQFFATGEFGQSYPTGHHLTFTPRLREGAWLAERQLARAMMDVSDGLALDAGRLCRAGNVTLHLDLDAIPVRTPQTTLAQALGDGEDYELIFAVPPEEAARLKAEWPFPETRLTRLGEFQAAAATDCCLADAAGHPLPERLLKGFDHLM